MFYTNSNLEILLALDKLVYGHTEAKKALICLIRRSKRRQVQKWGYGTGEINYTTRDDCDLLTPSKCLLVGASGTGKTHLVKSLQRLADFPLITVDATQLNPTGAGGGLKEEDLRKMIVANAEELVKSSSDYHSIECTVDQTVVYIDEIDKLGNSFDSSGKWNSHVQSNFLTLIDNKDEFAGLSWIFSGAFSGIYDDKVVSNSIGFNSTESTKEKKPLTDEDIVRYGLLPEFVGRLNHIVELEKFTAKEFEQILIKTILPNKVRDLSYMGTEKIDITDFPIKEVTEGAVASSQGVRYMLREVEKHFMDLEFSLDETDSLLLLQ